MLPIRTINEIFRTIPSTKLASLVKGAVLSPEKILATTGGIASPPSLACTNLSKTALSHSLFVGERACPSRCTNPCHSHNRCKRTITPSLHTNPPKPTLSLAQHHVLASLVKGRWIDGTTQTFALLLSAGDTPAFSIYQTFLPSRRRDCFTPIEPLYPHSLLKSTSTASPSAKLASLVKGEVLSPEKFGRLPEGLFPIRTNPPKPALSLSLFVGRASVCACMLSHLHYPSRFS